MRVIHETNEVDDDDHDDDNERNGDENDGHDAAEEGPRPPPLRKSRLRDPFRSGWGRNMNPSGPEGVELSTY